MAHPIRCSHNTKDFERPRLKLRVQCCASDHEHSALDMGQGCGKLGPHWGHLSPSVGGWSGRGRPSTGELWSAQGPMQLFSGLSQAPPHGPRAPRCPRSRLCSLLKDVGPSSAPAPSPHSQGLVGNSPPKPGGPVAIETDHVPRVTTAICVPLWPGLGVSGEVTSPPRIC